MTTERRFGHYTLLGKLGAGGMGEVSLARDERLGREVALKMLPRRLAQDPESLQRFRREALTLASLNHPNIAVIHGFEEDASGALALVLERVEGESLADRLHRGALPTLEALHVCAQIAEALEAAHERGIIHRDLKPGNVMLAPRGLVKVLDFGLAHRIDGVRPPVAETRPRAAPSSATDEAPTIGIAPAADDASEQADTVVLSPPADLEADTVVLPPPPVLEDADTVVLPAPPSAEDADTVVLPAGDAGLPPTLAATGGSAAGLTTTGEVTGTPGYMSPEQVRGQPQDQRTDVFAFGCVLFECLTGARAVQGRTLVELLERALDYSVDLSTLPERTPAPVRDLLGRCLERDPALRLGEIRSARHLLEDVLGIRRAAALRAGEAAAIPNNLPASVTSFVGRERELAESVAQLESARWLTLSGMGGSGKTRLARRLAEQMLESFPDGVWFVDLTSLKHSERVPESLAEAAGIQPEPGVPIMTTLTRSFAERRVLAVLDNCEDVLEPVARLGAELLGACPSLKLLATSREPIGAPGEVVMAVAPLGLPEEGATADPGRLAASESVRLFVERAGAAKPGFLLGAANAGAIAEICRRLDGIPLAIELAAARVRMLSVDEIRARLGDRFKLLTAGGRGTPGRHQTLRATLEWSADHLSEDERLLFTRLGVFVGAWSLESAVAVAGEGWDEFDLLDALTRLVDRSMVVVTPLVAGETRYRYLETVRHFALERIAASGEESTLRNRHLDHFLGVAEESQTRLAGSEQKTWLARLDAEHNDLLAAHAWCGEDAGRAVPGLRLAGAMWRYWFRRGAYELATLILSEALARPGAAARSAERANALVRAGTTVLTRGMYQDARPFVEESLAISRELGDAAGVARCLGALSSIAIFQDELEEARALSTEALEYYRRLGRPAGVAACLLNLGYVAIHRGDLEEAQAHYEKALSVQAGTGDEQLLAHILLDFARVSVRKGELEVARVRYATALQLARGLSGREVAYALEGAGELAFRTGEPEIAARALGAAGMLRESIGSPLTPVESKDLALLLGQMRDALGSDVFAARMAEARMKPLETTVTAAIEWLEGTGFAASGPASDAPSGVEHS